MKAKIRCLTVSSREEPFTPVEDVLAALTVKTIRARTCAEAEKLLNGSSPTHLVWTDSVLRDGDCMDVLKLTQQMKEKVNVVVLSPHADIELYLDAMNHGAFDYVTEAFTVPELVYVLRGAIEDACQNRAEPSWAATGARALMVRA